MRYRLILVLSIIFLISAYIGQAIGHAFLLFNLFKFPIEIGIVLFIMPVGWWPEFGLIYLIGWIITGGNIFDLFFDKWDNFLCKIEDAEDDNNIKNRMDELEHSVILKELDKEFPGIKE